MIANTLMRILNTSKNGSGKALAPLWIPYKIVVDREISNSFHYNITWSKDLVKDTMGLLRNIKRDLLNISIFINGMMTGLLSINPSTLISTFYSMSTQKMIII